MDTSSSFIPIRARVGRKRRPVVEAPTPPSVVTVVKVVSTQDGNGRWYFSSPVTNFPEAEQVGGLIIDGLGPVAFIIITEDGALELQYPAYVAIGTNWMADDSIGPIELTFASGLPLQLPESGTVVAE